jgi:Flp pilus assembly protein TadB
MMAKLPFKFLLFSAAVFAAAAIVSLIKGELLNAAVCVFAAASATIWAMDSYRRSKRRLERQP